MIGCVILFVFLTQCITVENYNHYFIDIKVMNLATHTVFYRHRKAFTFSFFQTEFKIRLKKLNGLIRAKYNNTFYSNYYFILKKKFTYFSLALINLYHFQQ